MQWAGLHAIEGNGGSSDSRTMKVAGTVYLKEGMTVSVHVYSDKDTSFFVETRSGLSCHQFGPDKSTCSWNQPATLANCATNTGFGAMLKAKQNKGKGWKEVTSFRTTGMGGALYNSRKQFDPNKGRFNAKSYGTYLCSVQLRLDGAAR